MLACLNWKGNCEAMGCPRLLIETLPLPVPLERPVLLPVWLERPVMFDLLVPVPVLDTDAEAEAVEGPSYRRG